MELELGLGPPNQAQYPMGMIDLNCGYNNYGDGRGIGKKSSGFVDDDDEEEEVESKGLSLLLWSGHDDDDDKDGGYWKSRRLHVNDEEINDEEIEGWPPINSSRKEFLQHHHHRGGGWMANHHHHRRPDRVTMIKRSSMYVKVKMEGVPIGRKIDLRLFNSYRTLTDTLIDMFAKYNKNERRHEEYTILYQDKEGDWMLAGDAPWESFVECVQRMEIVRKNH